MVEKLDVAQRWSELAAEQKSGIEEETQPDGSVVYLVTPVFPAR